MYITLCFLRILPIAPPETASNIPIAHDLHPTHHTVFAFQYICYPLTPKNVLQSFFRRSICAVPNMPNPFLLSLYTYDFAILQVRLRELTT